MPDADGWLAMHQHRQLGALRTERHGDDRTGRRTQGKELSKGLGLALPEAYRAVFRSGDQELTVEAEGKGFHAVAMRGQFRNPLARGYLVQADRPRLTAHRG